jgi:TRAP transporter TAXI family solute receptor
MIISKIKLLALITIFITIFSASPQAQQSPQNQPLSSPTPNTATNPQSQPALTTPKELSQPPSTQQNTQTETTSQAAPTTTKSETTETQATSAKPLYEDKLVIVATGAVTGVYYPAGGAVCRLINRDRKTLGLRCAVESTPGSIYNLDALKNDEVDFAIVQSDWQEHAYNGTGHFANKRMSDLRFIMSLHNESLVVIVKKDSDVQKFADIKGHIVNMGPEGSGVRATMEEVMKAKNWTNNDFKNIAEFKPSDQPKALCDGKIDVMILATGHPNASIQELINMCDTRIVEIDDPDIDRMLSSDPEFSFTIIPGGVYPGSPKDIKTFGVKATLVTLADTHDDIVYNLTRLVFDNIQSFKNLHPVFSLLDPEKMALEGKTAPYHPGAEKFYAERGFKTK